MRGLLAYAGGQWLSAWRWWLLLGPVDLRVPYLRMVAFYFIGMFFNFFLPTIVGGDAVKAVLLARETGAPARATMSVFMERNVGLFALLTIATAAAFVIPGSLETQVFGSFGSIVSVQNSIDWLSMLLKVARDRSATLCGGTRKKRRISST